MGMVLLGCWEILQGVLHRWGIARKLHALIPPTTIEVLMLRGGFEDVCLLLLLLRNNRWLLLGHWSSLPSANDTACARCVLHHQMVAVRLAA